MITRLEIDGFKSFRNFSVDLRPFQVFIGENGSGKSNLFDAITLLGRLSHMPIADALRGGRGDVLDQFSHFDGKIAERISLAVEMLLPHEMEGSFSSPFEVATTRIRYELQLARQQKNGRDYIALTHESLQAIPQNLEVWAAFQGEAPIAGKMVVADSWPLIVISKEYHHKWLKYADRLTSFISMLPHAPKHVGTKIMLGSEDSEQPNVTFDLDDRKQTVLSEIISDTYPTAYRVRSVLQTLQMFNVNATAMRNPVDLYAADRMLSDGSNAAAIVYSWQQHDLINAGRPVTLTTLRIFNNFVGALIPNVRSVEAVLTDSSRRIELYFHMIDGQTLPASVMSDGSLRMLAIIALACDPNHTGTICLEEPENGINPLLLEQWYKLVLRDLATDFSQSSAPYGLRQVLINTHSPAVINYVPANELLMVLTPSLRRNTRVARVDETDLLNQNDPNLAIVSKHYIRRVMSGLREAQS